MATTFAVPDGRVAMNIVLRNGFGTSGGSVTSLNFQPDLVWEKARNSAYTHQLIDSVRGVSKSLHSNLVQAEDTYPTYVTSFNANGYTLGAGDYIAGDILVDWCWKAGGAAVSNTAGTITSSVSANTTAGFSVVTYTGTGVNATVGHGLGVVPGMVIIKSRTNVYNWVVYHSGLTSATYYVSLNQTIAQTSYPTVFNSTAPTSTVFSIGTDASINQATSTHVAYCWAPVAGYSAFGTYTGNGVVDGPFIYTGFRPRFIMIKSSSTAYNWFIQDTSRDPTNVMGLDLMPNLAQAEAADSPTNDFLSNGFKVRNTYVSLNASGATYIYAAFAENPLKYANAR